MSITLSANPNERIYGFMKTYLKDFAKSQGKTYHKVRRDLLLGLDPDLTRSACDWIANVLKGELKSHQEQAAYYRDQIKEIQSLKKKA
jgi:hypothetical protein